jgi:hypothetical protein
MKVCTVCNEIVAASQGCARSDCPNQAEVAADPAPKLQPGYTGKADRFVQAGLDGADSVARETTRRAFFIMAGVFAAILFAGIFVMNNGERQTKLAVVDEVSPRQVSAADQNNASAEGSFVQANDYALSAGMAWVGNGEEIAWERFDAAFSDLGKFQRNGIPFCRLEVTAHVSYSVPCDYEQNYLYIFTAGSFGTAFQAQ